MRGRDVRRGQRGFTLIELLIVVVIIGILAAIAIPKFAATKEKAYVSKMKSDLRNLVTAQEAYSADNPAIGYYMGAVPNVALVYNPSSGVNVTITEAGPSGWAATAAHVLAPARVCAIFYGTVGAIPPPATVEGVVVCN
jgi:prepilin-type N-terminal cleavage/methylation domain-containing protein